MRDNNEKWERELQMGLERMDSWVTPSVDDLHVWEQLVIDEKRSQRKKLLRELLFFWIIASVVLILGFISISQLPIVYVVVQLVGLLGFPLYGVLKERKKVRVQ